MACATPAKPPDEVAIPVPATQKLAPKDEPSRVLSSFESVDDLRMSKALNVEMNLVPEGATLGDKALKLTVAIKEPKYPSHGVRLSFSPPQSWAEMHELAVDVTNPDDEPQHVMISLIDAVNPDPEHRRKGAITVPPHTTETMRLPLTGEWTPLPVEQRSGVMSKPNGVEVDLTKIRHVWFLTDRSKAGQSIMIDNVRLVKRDPQGVAISAGPKAKLPKVAVLDLIDVTGELGARAKLLTTLVYDECAAPKTSEVISSAEIVEMLGVERQKELLGCTESNCLAEIGGALGSDYLLSSQVGRIGSRMRVDIRLIDARKSKVLSSAGDFVTAGGDDGLADAVTRLVRQVLHDSPLAAK